MDEQCSVVVVDDHPRARQALADVVTATPGLILVATLDGGEQAVRFAVRAGAPLLVVLDVRMPGLGGIDAARRITALDHGHVVVLVSTDDISWPLSVGARTTFLSKSRVTGGRLHDAWRTGRSS